MNHEREIAVGPRLSLALRARRGLLLLGAAFGFAAAGATVVVSADRGAEEASLSVPGPDCEFWDTCPDSWWHWPSNKDPLHSPPTAVLTRRWGVKGHLPI